MFEKCFRSCLRWAGHGFWHEAVLACKECRVPKFGISRRSRASSAVLGDVIEGGGSIRSPLAPLLLCTALLEDLGKALKQWDAAGEFVAVYMDANEDVRNGPVSDMFMAANFYEQITGRHAPNPPPATHEKNTKGVPIDGIWTNFANKQMRCGYLPFGAGYSSDHCIPWIDIDRKDVFGYRPPHLYRVFAPALTSADPRIRKKYNKLVTRELRENGTTAKVKLLRTMVEAGAPVEEVKALHHEIGISRKIAGQQAGLKLRKKHTGAFPFSPKVQNYYGRPYCGPRSFAFVLVNLWVTNKFAG